MEYPFKEDLLANWAFEILLNLLGKLKFLALSQIGKQTVHFNLLCHIACCILSILPMLAFPPWIRQFSYPVSVFLICLFSFSLSFFLDQTACNTVTINVDVPKYRSFSVLSLSSSGRGNRGSKIERVEFRHHAFQH